MSSHPIRQAAQFLLGVPTEGIHHTLGRMLAWFEGGVRNGHGAGDAAATPRQ